MSVAIKVSSYEQLTEALDARRRALGMSMEAMDHRSGLTAGYSAKLMCCMRHVGRMSLPVVLDTLQCDLLVMPRNQSGKPAPAERRTHIDPTLGRTLAPRQPEGEPAQ